MKVGFFLYNIDKEGMFKSYYTIGAIDSKALILNDDVKYKDIIFDILNELRLTIDNPRVLFLGNLNTDMFHHNDIDNDIDVISIDVSGLPIKNFINNYDLIEKTAYMIKREDNSIILGMFIKTLILRNQLAINTKEDIDDKKTK